MSLEDPAWTLNECRRVRHRSLGTSQQLVADQWNGPRAGLLARVGIALEVVVAEAI